MTVIPIVTTVRLSVLKHTGLLKVHCLHLTFFHRSIHRHYYYYYYYYYYITWIILEHTVAQLVEALRYKPNGRGFDSRWCHWNFSLT